MGKNSRTAVPAAYIRPGSAPAHKDLVTESVHVFVDDQNLFWGLQNSGQRRDYRIDFGLLLAAAAKDARERLIYSARRSSLCGL